MSGCSRPNRLPDCCASRAIRPAHSGATALVPPTAVLCPLATILYPVTGSALPATSGTPRPREVVGAGPPGGLGCLRSGSAASAVDAGPPLAPAETTLACHVGTPNTSLYPPPPAPPPWDPAVVSFHTVSA